MTKKISIIDCFSSHYVFDDKILKFYKEEWERKGFKIYQADSFASIHTATNSSWYRFRKQCKNKEQFFLYLRHTLASEKAYGMITLLLEPSNLDTKIKNELIDSVDVVLEI